MSNSQNTVHWLEMQSFTLTSSGIWEQAELWFWAKWRQSWSYKHCCHAGSYPEVHKEITLQGCLAKINLGMLCFLIFMERITLRSHLMFATKITKHTMVIFCVFMHTQPTTQGGLCEDIHAIIHCISKNTVPSTLMFAKGKGPWISAWKS